MRAFILAVSALNSHLREDCLDESEVKQLLDLAASLLTLEGIKPRTSRLSYLHWELHYIRSQLDNKAGRHLSALWDYETGLHLAKIQSNQRKAFDLLTQGRSLMGLGLLDAALECLDEAESLAEHIEYRSHIKISKIRCLRFMHQYNSAEALCAASEEEFSERPRMRLELRWERACLVTMQSGKINELVNLCRRDQSHYQGGYVLELFYWIYAHRDESLRSQQSKLSTLARKKSLQLSRYGIFYRLAVELEKAWDPDVSYTIKIQQLKRVIDQYTQVFDLDKKALILLALVRWLQFSQNKRLAYVVFAEYESLSLRASGGQCSDLLCLASDLKSKLRSNYS